MVKDSVFYYCTFHCNVHKSVTASLLFSVRAFRLGRNCADRGKKLDDKVRPVGYYLFATVTSFVALL